MKIDMHIHRVSTHPKSVKVEINGEETDVVVQDFEVEMTSVGHGSWILHFSKPSEIEEAKTVFFEGQTVSFSV